MVQINLVSLGILAVFIGIILIFLGTILHSKGKAEFGFVGFIGPFPIGFGSSKEMLYISLIISIVIMIVLCNVKKI